MPKFKPDLNPEFNPELKPIATPAEIGVVVSRIAREIERDYDGQLVVLDGQPASPRGQPAVFDGLPAGHACKIPVLVGVMKGAFVFLADLARELRIPVEIDFIRAACYGAGSVPSDEVLITRDIEMDIAGRDVIVVEDIVDRGVTVDRLMGHLRAKKPSTIRLCSLLLRENGRPPFKVDYAGMVVGKGFAVGYGLDYKERYRNLPGLHAIDVKDRG
ncbi:MAG: hypoxanthine phosphoribosyltransferase [Deltaproteobacteria bacterium]|nr:hypoxanthine phosphoribosyltransferase [Deltaproteobacteria bacterium]